MGAWDVEPWQNDAAADFFADFFRGIDFDNQIDAALNQTDDPDVIRAACFLLQKLGRVYVWAGDPSKLARHLDHAVLRLEAMLDFNHPIGIEMRELWGETSEIFETIKGQIAEIQERRSQCKSL